VCHGFKTQAEHVVETRKHIMIGFGKIRKILQRVVGEGEV